MTKKIYLTNNKGVALVDDEDYDWLNQYKWHIDNIGYAKMSYKINKINKTIRMHQLLIYKPTGMQTDHINGNKLNNQKENLRIVTQQQNQMNKIKRKNMTSKYKGVSWFGESNKWRADIMLNKKQYYLGLFNNEIDAAKAYNKRALELFGEYANLNEI